MIHTPDINDAGLSLIKASEGFEPEPYLCPAGVKTAGYGTTAAAGVDLDALTYPLTEGEAEGMLLDVLARVYEPVIDRFVHVDLNQNQFSALVSLVYNIGADAFRRSTLLDHLNNERYREAADEFLRWIWADGEIYPGLVERREAERTLFLTADQDPVEDHVFTHRPVQRAEPMPIQLLEVRLPRFIDLIRTP